MEVLLALGDDRAELPRRDVDSPLPQLLQKQGLGDVGVVVLVQDVRDDGRAVVTLAQLGGQRTDPELPRWRLPPLQTETGVVQLDPDVLDREILIPLEPAPFGELFGRNADGLVDRQLAGLATLGSLLRPVTLLLLPPRALQPGWFDLRLGLLALQPGDLVPQLLNLLLLMVTDLQQPQHQRRDLIRGELRELRDFGEAV